MKRHADFPKTLGDLDTKLARAALLTERHVAPLTKFVKSLRRTRGPDSEVPDFDPWDGGIDAECLFLLEAPGGRAVASGFVSRNNPDETAKNFFLLNQHARLPRERTITWNVVPWYVGTGRKIRAVNRSDIAEATPHLERMVAMLPRLRIAVLVGRKAQRVLGLLERLRPDCEIFMCPHPSPLVLNGRPHRREEILSCLEKVARRLRAR
jgi:uracil-DNA glycosylase